jgi:hypothetical protein
MKDVFDLNELLPGSRPHPPRLGALPFQLFRFIPLTALGLAMLAGSLSSHAASPVPAAELSATRIVPEHRILAGRQSAVLSASPQLASAASPAPACSVWDVGYIDCLIGEISTTVAHRLFEAVRPFLEWIENNPLNFVTRTPAQATYNNDVVQRFVSFGILVVDAALAVRILLIAYQIMLGRSIGLPSLSVLEALPRVALLVAVAHNSLLICQWLIDFNNALCQQVDALFQQSLLRLAIDAIFRSFAGGTGLINLLLLLSLSLFLAVQVLLVAWQMLVRLATVVLLTSLSPLAFLTEAWLRRWISAFVSAVLVQFLQVSALALGGMLAASFAGQILAGFSDQLIISLLVSNAFFFLILRIPGMLHEYMLGPTVAAGHATEQALSGIVGRFRRTL